jgi:hypothetical protein
MLSWFGGTILLCSFWALMITKPLMLGSEKTDDLTRIN